MTANEVMIGDWVLYNPNVFIEDEYELPKDCYPTKISCGEDIDLAIEDCYSPIQLTKEILEKNGFLHSMPHNDWTNDKVDFILVEHGDGYRVQNTSMMLVNVHEFQHALRLCGIDKEIEL